MKKIFLMFQCSDGKILFLEEKALDGLKRYSLPFGEKDSIFKSDADFVTEIIDQYFDFKLSVQITKFLFTEPGIVFESQSLGEDFIQNIFVAIILKIDSKAFNLLCGLFLPFEYKLFSVDEIESKDENFFSSEFYQLDFSKICPPSS